MIASLGAGVLVLLLVMSYVLSSGLTHSRDTGIVLPGEGEDAPAPGGSSRLLTAQSVAEVEIGTDNAQRVIASLERPAAYSCTVENTLYYTGGSSTLRCRRYARDDAVRTDTLGEGDAVTRTLLRAGDRMYAWDAGDSEAYAGAWGDFSDDAAAMLPTYEDVLAEGVALTDAGRQDIDYEPCIMAAFERDGYRCVYFVSAASGLLRAASFYRGETLTRRVEVSDLQTELPDEGLFTLPDGQSVLGE